MFRKWIISMFYASYKQSEAVGGLFRRLAIRRYPELADLTKHIGDTTARAVAAGQVVRKTYRTYEAVVNLIREAEHHDMDPPLYVGIYSLHALLDPEQVDFLIRCTYPEPIAELGMPRKVFLEEYIRVLYRTPELNHVCNLGNYTYAGRRYHVLSHTIERLKELYPRIDTAIIYNTLEIHPCSQSSH